MKGRIVLFQDTVLRRTQQFNINALLEKLFEDFEDHFKVKPLSVADKTFDGVFSRRFKGLGKKSSDTVGFNIPDSHIVELVLKNCLKLASNLFQVPSKTDTNKSYVVAMSISCCECNFADL